MSDSQPEPEISPGTDWVGGRGACTAEALFECLQKRVELDVERRNSLGWPKGTSFECSRQASDLFLVWRRDVRANFREIRFKLRSDGIIAISSPELSLADVHVQWNEQQVTCQVLVGADPEPKELWEISQLVLAELFFD